MITILSNIYEIVIFYHCIDIRKKYNFDFYQDQIFSDTNLSYSIINDENIFTKDTMR